VPVDPSLAAKSVETASKFKWDFPYRFLASVGATTSAVSWWTESSDRPLDVFARASRWAGVDIARHAKQVNDWLNTPSRVDIIASAAVLVMLVSAAAVLAWANQYRAPGETRAAATLLLAATVLAQVHGPPDLLNWVNLFLFWVPLAISLVLSIRRQWHWHATIGLALFDLLLSAVYAALIPLLWSTALETRPNNPEK